MKLSIACGGDDPIAPAPTVEPGCPVGSHDDGSGSCVAALGGFSETSAITEARDHHVTWAAARASGAFLYVAGGGHNMHTPTTSVERAAIGPDGLLGPWETLPQTFASAGPIVASTDARVLFAGGIRSGGVSTASESLAILDDGSLGAIESGPALNVARFHGAAVRHGGFVYATGGLDGTGTSTATVERIAFSDAGPSGEWILESEEMPEQRSHHGLALHEGALYVTGGLTRIENDFANDIVYDTVLRAEIGADGSLGPFAEIATLPVPLAVHSSFVHAGQLYLAHGLELGATTAFTGVLRRADLLDDGSLGPWEELASAVPIPRGHCHQTPLVDGFLYSIAGTNNLGSQTSSFVALFE